MLVAGLLCTGAFAQPASPVGSAQVARERPTLTPGIVTSLSYSDNVLHLPDDRKTDDVVLEVSPYVMAESTSRRANYTLFYQLRNLWRLDDGDSALFRHSLDGRGTFALGGGERLWVDLQGFMGYVNNLSDGRLSGDPIGSFSSSEPVRRASISPYFVDRVGNAADVELRYFVATTSDSAQYTVATLDQRVSGHATGIDDGRSPWNWRVFGQSQRRDYDDDINRDRSLYGATLYHRLNPRLRVSASIEYEQIEEVRNSDGDSSGYGPALGFEWRPNLRTAVDGSLARRYYGNVARLHASYTPGASTFGLQLSRSVITSVDESLLLLRPQALAGPAGNIDDQTIEALIASGLIPQGSIALTQGLVTDAPTFDERVMLFYGLRGARNAFAIAGFVSDRSSVDELTVAAGGSGLAIDSPIGVVFAGKLRERGIIATFQHRLGPISHVELRLDRRHASSPTTDLDSTLTELRIAYGRQLGRNTFAFGGIRQARQSSNDPGNEYRERMVFVGLDVRFR
ncbi:MAG: TIGR03016 family PEP-CTERM system-associated outer membrane protein [Burkholderiaceae bacterium]|nr:TIGR03016 family PEP-CTERM system-associated outer membrane protein [Burkholderiaceae bacterium]